MHLAVSWDVAVHPQRTEIVADMMAVLQPFSWFKPLETFYVVKTDVLGRSTIITGLTAVGQKYPALVRFVVTPLMQGPYQGFLNADSWPKMSERTS